MKAPVRSRSIGTKVTEEEYARLEAQAAERKQSLSEWSREAMLSAAESGTGTPAEQTLLAEVLALRTILVNLFFQLGVTRGRLPRFLSCEVAPKLAHAKPQTAP